MIVPECRYRRRDSNPHTFVEAQILSLSRMPFRHGGKTNSMIFLCNIIGVQRGSRTLKPVRAQGLSLLRIPFRHPDKLKS